MQSVLITNYIYSPSNCLVSSSMYSICCQNECEGLFGHLEREIAEPDATPTQIIDLVSNLPSATDKAPRVLSAELRSLLDEVASHHRGLVPLHGRLFGQWMHHAYPRECPYPHKAGTTKPVGVDEWELERGADAAIATDDEMQHHVTSEPTTEVAILDLGSLGSARWGGENDTVARPNMLMWSAEEELLVSTTAPPGHIAASLGRSGMMVVALMLMSASLLRSSGS